ncbi:multidrug resistance-associated protein 5-like isoform X1 [Thrips palmi]|uniref:ATP-binding cassette sub-family C member 5 n=1 Tax=Thrips palmi TaxID=161013 RepID=A0A6P8ZZ17_THRPL|nr:multidrug resistance-associated protein 5-like isoform X1 [Thrips palmi]
MSSPVSEERGDASPRPSIAVNLDHGVADHQLDPEDGFLDIDLGNGPLPQQLPRIHARSRAPYIPQEGLVRYQAALRSLIPVRRNTAKKTEIGVDQAGLFSFILSTWLSRLMYKAYRKGLVLEDIPRGSPLESCDHNVQRLEMLWQEELRNKGPSSASFSCAVWRFIRTRFIADCLVFAAVCILGFLTPMVFMRKLLEFAQDPDADILTGLMWAFLLMSCEVFRILSFSWRWSIAYRTGTRLRAACLGMMYRKIVRLNNFEEKSMGQLINVFANDCQRIFDMVVFGPMAIGGPMMLVSGITYVLCVLGPWALLGVLVFVAFYPVQYLTSRMAGLLKAIAIRASDKRISIMTEILTHMKTIKMNAWEDWFEDQIRGVRAQEQTYTKRISYLLSLGTSLAPTVPIISAIVAFVAYVASGNSLTAAQAFSVQAVFYHSIRSSLRHTQFAITAYFEARIGLNRLQECLLVEEVQPRIHRPIDRAQSVSIGGATFTWSDTWSPSTHQKPRKKQKKIPENKCQKSDLEGDCEEKEKLNEDANQLHGFKPVLYEINFCAPKGYLVGVCGTVGSGKTSLLLSIMGQMRLLNGQLARDGSCAFVSQQAWITNGTLRDNILFGETFASTRYYTVINSCALNEDINQLPGGDLTEIGERGVNLSGGQKQRVALARALYANRDIYLLDDPLSAVDVNVGSHIFESYVQRELRNKTVVLVTHQIQYLSHCDQIYLMKEGRILEKGTHEELLKMGREYATMVNQTQCSSPEETPHSTNNSQINRYVKKKEASEQLKNNDYKSTLVKPVEDTLIVNEPSNTSSLKTDTFCRYISAVGGYVMTTLVFLTILINAGSTAFSSWWLATWIKAGGGNITIEVNNRTITSTNLGDNPDYEFYLSIYASCIGLILLTCALRCFVFTKATIRASFVLHNDLFQKVLRSPMLFFETNPIGRMQNVFSKDLDEVDSRLPSTLENIISSFYALAFAFLFICIVFPWFFIAFIPLGIIYYFGSRIFRKGIRDLKRLENTSRAPVFSNLVETVQGINTIHAFGKESEYTQRFFQLLDENITCNYMCNVGTRWLAVRLDLLAVFIVSITASLVVGLHGIVVPAMAGLALSYSWQICGVLQYATRLLSEGEVRFISVERILAYTDTTFNEEKGSSCKIPPSWPNEGRIHFQNVSMSYHKNLPNCLHNVNFSIKPGEKIGIVGRTGSGKSSLTAALFRLIEPNSGHIKLDGMDISNVPLSILRVKISIIPQEPVLFSGTIRSNLDPQSKCTDEELWDALAETKLSEKIGTMPLKLETELGSGSIGLSVGESQLLCLARALLRNSKVLILDEATASIDPEVEAAVQTSIEEAFKNCTVIMIAHRLITVTNCDRILVMSEGRVVEFDEPNKLLADPSSLFAKMKASSEA